MTFPGPAPAPDREILAVGLDACRGHLAEATLAPGEGRELAESLAEAARDSGLPELEHACLLLAEALTAPEGEVGAGEQAVLLAWVEAVEAAMATTAGDVTTPGAPALDRLSALLRDPRLPSPLDADDLAGLEPAPAQPPSAPEHDGRREPEGAGSELDAPELSDGLTELVDLLRSELEPLAALVTEALDAGDGCAEEACEHVAEQVECFAAAAEAAGLDGLQRACGHLAQAWRGLAAGEGDRTAAGAPLAASHEALARYVAAPFHARRSARLVEGLVAIGPLAGLAGDAADALRAALADADAAVDVTEDEPERIVRATPELVSLEIPDDVPAELLETLLHELPLITAELSGAVARLAGGGTIDDVNVAQRAAHTLKGAANTVGVPGLANLTHHVEDVLRAFFEAQVVPAAQTADELIRVADCLEAMSESITGVGPAPDDALEVLQAVLDTANRIDSDGVAAADTAAPGETAERSAAPAEGAPEPAERAAAEAPVRVPAALIDDVMRLTGETIILTGQVQEQLSRTLAETRSMHGQLGALQQLGYELEQFIDLGGAPTVGMRSKNDPLFDPLEMDEYNELHTLSRRMVEAAADAREMGRAIEAQLYALGTMLADQGRLNRESHESVLETRMVPVSTIVSRLQRAARQAARATGKTVELEVRGAETRMDADVLGELVDPLMHVLRNAVDHGIEPEASRLAAGKAPGGQITLEFARAGNHVVARCADDGGGIDHEAVRAAAVERGRIGAGELLSEEDALRLIVEPGFSTRASATQVSGRGIGLDAVNGRIVALGGTFELESERGAGCVVELGVPLTLISAHVLLVRVRQHVFAVSARGISQIVHADGGAMEVLGDDRRIYRAGDAVYEATLLDSMLVLPRDPRAEEREARTAIITQGERGPIAVMVQDVIDSRDVVIKSLGRYVPRVRGIVGATIVGDGSVTPVLDLPDLLRSEAQAPAERPGDPGHRRADHPSGHPFGADSGSGRAPDPEERLTQTIALPTALVVDDSLSARRSLERVMSDSGYDVRTARDGVEAVEILAGLRPDVMLVDMEMPRMNGLELVAHMRSAESTAEIPVVMVTSRSTAKHRQQAERVGVDVYLTKPFSEDELLDHVAALHAACA